MENVRIIIRTQIIIICKCWHSLLAYQCCIFILRLEVYLTKSPGDWWSELVSGDGRGEMITDSDVADRIHENLSYLTTDTMVRILYVPLILW